MFASVATFNSSAVLLSISILASSAICWSATALVFAKRDAFLLCLASWVAFVSSFTFVSAILFAISDSSFNLIAACASTPKSDAGADVVVIERE